MFENRFPHYLAEEDRFLMEALCQEALAAWRISVAYHKGLATLSAKLNNRRNLEQSYDHLLAAWQEALASAEPMTVAA